MSKGTVYVVQQPAYFDRSKKMWVNKYDLSAATEYGELVFLLGPGNIYKDRLESTTEILMEELKGYGPNDHILAVGDPVAIALSTMIAGMENNGVISLLKYDRITDKYEAYKLDVSF